MWKKLILVCSPPASGKTYISRQLATNLHHVVYLDKDTLVPLSNVAFDVCNLPRMREGDFFEKNLRNVEYDVILDFAFEALKYDDIVLINAPFTQEIRDTEYINSLRQKLKDNFNAKLVVIWVETSPEIIKKRMIERNSPRDKYKLLDWDKYNASVDYSIPENLNNPEVKDDLLIFHNDTEEEYNKSMTDILHILEEE